ncbi:MAG: hypothetical protein ACRC62_39620 [Microcoleus sp.]
MKRNGVYFGLEGRRLQIDNKIILLPRDEDDQADFLRAIALVCAEAIGDAVYDADCDPIDSFVFFDKE